MNERVEEIKPISLIRPVRKLKLRNPKRGRRELTYQSNRYHQAKKRGSLSRQVINKTLNHNHPKISSNDFFEEITDIRKRLAFDRAMIIGN
ncbi:hypothetical protein Desaci_1531 [Desulfosporosinus acidiphilus SJ4]|uniref:Uncharacterized protein n=1 Tax=Desulfosporosinus acidiphilus (strain DSM 22704 / JCM 16185 / SJ4) TaxID=646529 RepID=I4D417_DESAJ|nr:hypothetical protein [Desulfosporosinus acidiphilus]AFM40541.1 hypothetical protein Desaci_1531 [Desulfosporosinus acidiphilus SJ4]